MIFSLSKEVNRGIIITIFLSIIVSFILTPIIKNFFEKKKILDIPYLKRKIHKRPVPRLGGIPIAIAFTLGITAAFLLVEDFRLALTLERFQGLIIGIIMVVFLGVVDDIYELSALFKLLFQILIAMLLYYFNFTTDVITHPLTGRSIILSPYINISFTILWTIGIMNAINLIDGLDGLASSISIISTLTLFIFAINRANFDIASAFVCIALAGSLLGFINYNLPPAKIFMGDSGSLFIGFILATIGLIGFNKSSTAMTLMIPLVSLTIPIGDTLTAIIRRTLRNKRIFDADKEHIHHRLLNIGLKDRQVLLILIILSIYFSIVGFLMLHLSRQASLILFAVFFISIALLIKWLKNVEIKFFIDKKMSNNNDNDNDKICE
jgi:UDP-GlcNAc:undecaprenyl-phosphate/decaprenyl-phosphate GlcNAc-1-phosphate transferase